MQSTLYSYPMIIKEHHLDTFGHVNNAVYLALLEEARWEILNQNHYGLKRIQETGIGPTILDIHIRFLKELRLHDHIVIETKALSYKGKVGTLSHTIVRDGIICASAELVLALFNLRERKLITPTPEWLQALGISQI